MQCQIRTWRMQDAASLVEILNNPRVQNNLRDGLPYPYTEKDAQDYIAAMLSSEKNNTFAFAICLQDKAIGSIGAFRGGNIHYRTAELGYYLGESYWGKGLGSSAVQQFCHYLFRNTDILRLFAEPFAHNLASCRILEKCGFQMEGILRRNAVKNGQILDMKLYALLREDWCRRFDTARQP